MALAPSENPAPAFPEDVLRSESGQESWWVAHTRSRREKALAHALALENVGYFLPLFRRRQPGRRRERFSVVPMFPGYLFFRGNGIERQIAFESNHVARIIEVLDRNRLIEELSQIEKSMSTDVPLSPHAFLKRGQRVRVRYGPLKDMEGILSRKKGDYRLVLNVSFISQAVSLDVDADLVEAV